MRCEHLPRQGFIADCAVSRVARRLCAVLRPFGSGYDRGTQRAAELRRYRRDCALPAEIVEPMTGIEPAYSAWEADVLPLNYIGAVAWEG